MTHPGRTFSRPSGMTNGKNGTVLHFSSFTNHLQKPTSAMNSGVIFSLLTAPAFFRSLFHASPPPLDSSSFRYRSSNRRSMCTKYCPRQITYTACYRSLANEKTSRTVSSSRSGCQPTSRSRRSSNLLCGNHTVISSVSTQHPRISCALHHPVIFPGSRDSSPSPLFLIA